VSDAPANKGKIKHGDGGPQPLPCHKLRNDQAVTNWSIIRCAAVVQVVHRGVALHPVQLWQQIRPSPDRSGFSMLAGIDRPALVWWSLNQPEDNIRPGIRTHPFSN
jgi:hypothetical protein